VTIRPDNTLPLANKGTIQGNGGSLSASGETIDAIQGTVAGLPTTTPSITTVDLFLAAINVAGAAAGFISPELVTAGSHITFALDNAKFNGSLARTDMAAFVTAVKSTAYWVSVDTTAYPLTNNSFFEAE
jgi:hypothetical protein